MTSLVLSFRGATGTQPDETWKNKLSPDQYYVLRMVSRAPRSLRNVVWIVWNLRMVSPNVELRLSSIFRPHFSFIACTLSRWLCSSFDEFVSVARSGEHPFVLVQFEKPFGVVLELIMQLNPCRAFPFLALLSSPFGTELVTLSTA